MNQKDIQNISNIYHNILNESKIGSNLSQPIQIGVNTPKSSPASTVVIKKKKRKISKKIFEGFFGGFLKGMELAKKGKLPLEGPKRREKQEKTGKTSKSGIGFDNPPQKGSIVMSERQPQIRGVVTKSIDKNGQFQIRLVGQSKSEVSPYKFYITDKYPQGIIALPNDKKGIVQSESDTLTVGFGTAYPNWVDYKSALQRF